MTNTNMVTRIEHRHVILANLYPYTTILAKADRVLMAIITQVVTVCATSREILNRDCEVGTAEV
jgi:hypothetical protein